jgi:ABC-2 type transport system permease protein/oleandomycin transport system permease protein
MTTLAPPESPPRRVDSERGHLVADALTIAWRNLVTIRRNPQLLMFATVQPVVFVVALRYVFGGAIRLPGPVRYVDFMIPGIFAQSVVFNTMNTAVGLADDLHKGIIDRFRSLPMARSAVLVGRTLADLVRSLFVVLLMGLVGYVVGWRVHTNTLGLVAAIGLILGFSYALSWVFAVVGLLVPDGETAQAASFPVIFPLVFASSAFVPVATMPGWLQAWAKNQPVSIVVDATRALTIGGPTATPLLKALVWIAAIVAVGSAFATSLYRRVT